MVLLALSAVFPAFAVEVLAFRLVEAEGRVRKAPKVSRGEDPVSQRFYCLSRLGPWVYPGHPRRPPFIAVRERRASG